MTTPAPPERAVEHAGGRRTGVILPVPALEHVVATHRADLDPHAAAGVPAHLTVLYPFVPVESLTEDVVRRVGDVVALTPAFSVTFSGCGWFDHGPEQVLWVRPDPAGPAEELTAALWAAFPDHPPYEGAFETPTAHLTVGVADEGDPERSAALRRAEEAVTTQLPVLAEIDHALVVAEGEDGRWASVARMPLGPRAPLQA